MISAVYKKKPIDFSLGNYRDVVKRRMANIGKKKYRTDIAFGLDANGAGGFILFANGDLDKSKLATDNVTAVSFIVVDERCAAEVVVHVDGQDLSLLAFPEETLEELGEDEVFKFYETFEDIANSAGVEIAEYIDDNSLGLSPGEGDEEEEEAETDVESDELDAESDEREEDDDSNSDVDHDASGVEDDGDELDDLLVIDDDFIVEEDENNDVDANACDGVDESADGSENDLTASDSDQDSDSDDDALGQHDADEIKELSDRTDDAIANYNRLLNTLENDFNDINGIAQESEDYNPNADNVDGDTDYSDDVTEEFEDATKECNVTATDIEYKLAKFKDNMTGGRDLIDKVNKYLENTHNPSEEFIRELASKLSDQNKQITDLENDLQREQRANRDSAERLAKAASVIDDQRIQIEKLAREAKIAAQGQAKAEAFVAEASETVSKIVEKTKATLDTTRRNMDKMRAHIDEADEARQAAEARVKDIEKQYEADRKEHENALAEAEEAKEDAARKVSDASARIDEFTREMSSKLADQVKRAEEAESLAAERADIIKRVESERDDAKSTLADKIVEFKRISRDKDAVYEKLVNDHAAEMNAANDEFERKYAQLEDDKRDSIQKIQEELELLNAKMQAVSDELDEKKAESVGYQTKYEMRCKAYDSLSKNRDALSESLSQLTMSTSHIIEERDEYAVFVDKERARVSKLIDEARSILSKTPSGLFGRKKKWEELYGCFMKFVESIDDTNETVEEARKHLADADEAKENGKTALDILNDRYIPNYDEIVTEDELDQIADEFDEDDNEISLSDLLNGETIQDIIASSEKRAEDEGIKR